MCLYHCAGLLLGMAAFGRKRAPEPVFLNVYDLSPGNDYLYPVGLGAFHSGVEVYGTEYSFGSGGGIFPGTPREAAGAKFRESIRLGEISISEAGACPARVRVPLTDASKFGCCPCNPADLNTCVYFGFCTLISYQFLRTPVCAAMAEVRGIVDSMRGEFDGDSYNVITK